MKEQKSQQQYKQQLASAFQNKGLQDLLKKQLRVKILDQLKNPHRQANPSDQQPLFKRVMSSLISQCLLANNLAYSNSVFLPEVGFEGKTLSRAELETLFKVSRIPKQTSMLEYFVTVQLPGNTQYFDYACQTNDFQLGYTMQQKMSMIDRKFKSSSSQSTSSIPSTQQIALIRKELQLTYKQQSQRDLMRFKQFEIQSVRLAEQEKYRRKYEEMREKLEENLNKRADELRKKERRAMDQEDQRRKEFEGYRAKEQEQLTKQKQLLEMRTANADELGKLSTLEKGIEKDKLTRLQQDLQRKIQQYDRLNVRAAQTIRYQVNLAKLAIQKQYQDKQLQTLEHKKAVDQDYYKMLSIKDSVQIVERENTRLVQENTELRKQMSELRREMQEAQGEFKEMGRQLELAREDRGTTQRERDQLEVQVAKEAEKVQKLQHQLSTTRRQLDQTRQDLQKARKPTQPEQDQPILNVPVPTSSKKPSSSQQLSRKMQQLRRNRKKQIQKLKLQL